MSLFGSSGIRQIADENLLALALKVGLCLGREHQRVILGRDTRTSGEALAGALAAGLLFSGAKTFDAGIVPTPTLAYVAQGFDRGAMVTASHNPPEYNGIKLLNPDGSSFDSRQRSRLEGLLADDGLRAVGWEEIGVSADYVGAAQEHISAIAANVSVERYLKIVVDCGCGPASTVTPNLLRMLGCEVIALNCHHSGFFPRPVEPLPENLTDLSKSVIALGADLGLAHDGDADRVVAVDGKGRFVAGDRLLVILAHQVKARKLVVNIDSSMAIDDQGFQVVRTMVGDTYISEELRKGGDFGGEPAGAFIFPSFSYCPDGIYGAAVIAQAASVRPLSQLADEIPEYPMLRGSEPGSRDVMPSVEDRLNALNGVSIDRTDGIRVSFLDGWLLVRPSGTEPKIRITAEARTRERVQEIYRAGQRAVIAGSKP